MATLTIRNLPDQVRDTLRVRAARNGRSMEAEVRDMLQHAVQAGQVDARAHVDRLQAEFAPFRDAGRPIGDDPMAERREETERDTDGVGGRRATQAEKLAEARALLRRHVPEGTPLVDEFLAGRRAMWGEE